ncbi:AraC family transcriptional regulator N-terminal domain-containing protein [Microcoleus sp. BR0-C5]|uniref:AraC family transcriptional regulator N-terminal domain-containing protein n=1 Tax=Microcoleus sp. BR0-C5 TaxID=2818713 RepID=UPI002FD1CCC4
MNAAKTSEKSARSFINDQQALREADRAQAHRDELTEAIPHDGTIEPLKGLHFNRSSSPSECVDSVSIPAFCVIAQGSKEVLLGCDRASVRPDALFVWYDRTDVSLLDVPLLDADYIEPI